jgi:N-acetylmuramoyl-L-alanine amidase
VLLLVLSVVGCTAAPASAPAAPIVRAQAATRDGPTVQPIEAAATATPMAMVSVAPTQPAAPTAQPTGAPTQATDAPAQASATLGQASATPGAATDTTGQPAGQTAAAGAAAAGGAAVAGPAGKAAEMPCDDSASQSLPVPGSPGAQAFFRSFRTPLAPAPLYDPPGPKRVGLQAGHWLTEQVPPELGRLQGGASGGGKSEWEVNLDVAQRTAALLEAAGIQADVLPATVPMRYQANAFLALHADGDPAGQARGFKVARPGFSSVPDIDDRFVDTLNQVYGAATDLPRDDEHISLRMRYYYAFNSRRYCHAVMPGVPQAIIEMAYLTSPVDRQWLIGDPDRLAHGIAAGVEQFLATLP